jgi:hypothetical protein
MSKTSQLGLRVIVVLIAVSVPLFLAIETALRVWVVGPLYGPVLAELRAFYWPAWTPTRMIATATDAAWILVGVAAVAGIVGVITLRRVVARGAAKGLTTKKIRDTLLLLTSIPQVPGLLATLCLIPGARWLPVLVCVAVSTSFVVAQGFIGERALEGIDAHASA